MTRADVVIVGSGAAGAAAAITLARVGADVLIVDRSVDHPTIGEGLPPSSAPLLQELGLWDRFLAVGHAPAFGNRSIWGDSAPREYDFIRSPFGNGWQLDRPGFDRMLTIAVEEAGSTILSGTRAVACRRASKTEWILTLDSGAKRRELRAGFMIDATGRTRWLARSLGVQRRVFDRLVAIVGVLPPKVGDTADDSFTMVEAAEVGWWYSTPLPDRRLVVGYMTDRDLAQQCRARTADGWISLLEQTTCTRDRVRSHDDGLGGHLRVLSAGSSCLHEVAGSGWCAVGDAAAAHDPLSSQGIGNALAGGIQAGYAVAGVCESGLAGYQEQMEHAYARYLSQWLGYYAAERRWPSSPFWQRRHIALEALLA